MEVHHHPHVEKKKFQRLFFGVLNDISCRNAWFYCREYQGALS